MSVANGKQHKIPANTVFFRAKAVFVGLPTRTFLAVSNIRRYFNGPGMSPYAFWGEFP